MPEKFNNKEEPKRVELKNNRASEIFRIFFISIF